MGWMTQNSLCNEAKVNPEGITRFSGVSNTSTLYIDGKMVNFSTGFLPRKDKDAPPSVEVGR